MMYSQQEYDMVRRQTMQIEAEKRALLRWTLIVISLAFALTLILLGWIYQRYSESDSLVREAQTKATNAEATLQQVSRELTEKKAILDKQAATAAKQNAQLDALIPKAAAGQASDGELAALAHAIYEARTDHAVKLPRIPPDNILRRYRYRLGNQVRTYVLVAGLVEGDWKLYSNLVGTAAPAAAQ